VLSVETVKSHMHALFELFEIGDVPQNRKRAELVQRAFERGAVPG
jgi:DNA-binding NarL/FixJ family response regulator